MRALNLSACHRSAMPTASSLSPVAAQTLTGTPLTPSKSRPCRRTRRPLETLTDADGRDHEPREREPVEPVACACHLFRLSAEVSAILLSRRRPLGS